VQGYRLRQLRGRGEVGTVWEAENAEGEMRALKFIPSTEEATRLEFRSIQLTSRLEHRYLLPVEKVLSYEKYFVVVMPLADGSLQDLFEAYQSEYGTGIDPKELCGLLTQAAAGLDFLNTQKHQLGSWPGGIQHCNIKPSNLLVFGEYVRVGDFGLASPTARAVMMIRRLNTVSYTAPEIYYGRLTNWTDQYALAACYVYLRGGKPAFSAAPEPGNLGYVRPAPDLSMLTSAERPILARALSSNGPDRWKTCSELMTQLSKAVVE
jgi:serine/threonine protein kinase